MTQPLLVITPADLSDLVTRLERIESHVASVTMAPKKDLLTLAEMAELLGVSKATIRRKMLDGKYSTVEVGGKTMFRRPE